MKIALIGYGAMGRSVQAAARARRHEVVAVIDPQSREATAAAVSYAALNGADMALDFSVPAAALGNIRACIAARINLVTGVTGWHQDLELVREEVAAGNIGLLWSSNFSIGVNVYLQIVRRAAQLIDDCEEYDIWGTEIHHNQKIDSPSGTAKLLEQIILENVKRKTEVVEDRLNRRIEPHEIHFSSTRGGSANFGHTVCFDSAADAITISHAARNRDGYALGAVRAAEWLCGKKGFFSMADFMGDMNRGSVRA